MDEFVDICLDFVCGGLPPTLYQSVSVGYMHIVFIHMSDAALVGLTYIYHIKVCFSCSVFFNIIS